MATLHVAWIKTGPAAGSNPGAVIDSIISAEALTTSGSSTATTSTRPAGATHALVTAVDANHYAAPGTAVSATTGVAIISGSFHVFALNAGTKIAGVTS